MDSSAQAFWRQGQRGNIEMVWARAEEGQGRGKGKLMTRTLKEEEKRKRTEDVHRCGEGGHAVDWCNTR